MQKLCEQVWERILGYLEAHHQARLFETGDKSVQKWVIHSSRTFEPQSRSDADYSALVCDMLAPFARECVVRSPFLHRSSVLKDFRHQHNKLRMKRLEITSSIGKYVDVALAPGEPRTVYDLTAFGQLEELAIVGRTYVGLIVPPSLTSLAMVDNCFELVQNMTCLSNLTHLSSPFDEDQLESLRSVDWPRTLTSMEVWIMTPSNDVNAPGPTLDGLPSTLRHLTLNDISGSGDNRVLDIIPPPVCVELESFEIGPSKCELKQPNQQFPSSLKKLRLDGLYFGYAGRESPLRALAHSSITDLNVKRLCCGDDTAESRAEFGEMLVALLPKLNSTSLIVMINLVAPVRYFDDRVAEMCIPPLVRFGYCANFLNFVLRLHRHSFSEIIDAANKCENQHLLRRYLARSADAREKLARMFPFYIMPDKVRTLAINWLVSSGIPPPVKVTSLCLLQQAVIGKLEELVIDEGIDDLPSALSKWRFDSVTTVTLPSMSSLKTDPVVSALYANRRNFPALACFRRTGYTVGEESSALLAEMRLYHSKSYGGEYTYRVAPPRKRP